MLRLRDCMLVFVALSATGAACAQSALVGVGTGSCGAYLEVRAARSEHFNDSLSGWISGFVSGMNNSRFKLTKAYPKLLPDSPSMLAYLDKYCRENPLKAVWQGADALFEEL
jgi:hypothetical protein